MKLRGRSLVAIGLACFLFIAAAVIWRRAEGSEQRRELRDLDRQRLQLEAERTRLLGDIQDASSRGSLAPVVERRLDMRVPADSQVILIPRRTP